MATPKKRSPYGKRADALLSEQVNLVDEAGRAFDDWRAAKLAAVEHIGAAKEAAAKQIAQAKAAADKDIADREDAYKIAYGKAETAWSRTQLTDFGLPRPKAARRADKPAAPPSEPPVVASEPVVEPND